MKKLLLLFAMCSSLGAWAQDPNTYGSGDNMITLNAEGSTLTITGKGNIGDITAPITTTYFALPAVGNVFTSDAGADVATSLAYNPAYKYYTASREYTPVFTSDINTTGGYVSNITTTKSWNESKLTADNVYLYLVNDGGNKLGWTTNSGYIYPVEQNAETTGTWIDTKVNGKYIYKIMNDNGSVKITDSQVTSSVYENVDPVDFNGQNYIPYVVSNSPLVAWSNHALDNLETEGIVILSKSNVSEYANLITEIKVKGESVVGQTMETWQKEQLAKMNGAYSENYAFIISNSTHNIDDLINIASDDFTFITASNLNSYIKNIKNLSINGERITAGNIDGALTTFEYDSKDLVYYVITSEAKTNGTLIPIGDPVMTVFTLDEINEYINSTTTFKCTSDKLYVSKDAGENKSLLANGNTYTYEAGDLYYVAGDATYNEIEDNATYFAAHTSYLNNDTQYENIWPMLVNKINTAGYTELYLKSEGSAYATISNKVTQHMMKLTTVEVLDLSGVQIPSIGSGNPGESDSFTNGTFIVLNDANNAVVYSKNASIVDLRLPHILDARDVAGNAHRHVPTACCQQFDVQLASVRMPDNATCIEHNAFTTGSGGFNISNVTFNEGLERIGDEAFKFNYFKTLTFPSTLRYIGHSVFTNGLNDVYFLSQEAPIVEKDAFDTKAYLNNNAIKDNDLPWDWYRIDRGAYESADYMAAMLHLPKDMTKKQRAKYTDPTRDYHVMEYFAYNKTATDVSTIEEAQLKYPYASGYEEVAGGVKLSYGLIKSNDPDRETLVVTSETDKKYVYYCSGNPDREGGVDDFAASWGTGAGTGVNTITGGGRLYGYAEVDGLSGQLVWHNDSEANHYKNSGFYDKSVGMQYIWPSHAYMNRAFTVASNNKLWGGTMTIADGIDSQTNDGIWAAMSLAEEPTGPTPTTVTYDTDCNGVDDVTYNNGEEYMGLHEFILVTHDVNAGTTPDEYEFEIGGANWYTICVPFDMTVKQVRETFGQTTQVCKFNDVTRDSEDMIRFYFTNEQCLGNADLTVKAIVANVPYMIRPSNAIDTDEYHFTLPNYEMDPLQVPERVSITTNDATTGLPYTYTFVGQYNTASNGAPLYMPQYSYYLGAVKSNPSHHKLFIQTGQTGKWKPNTCVILASDGEDDYNTFFNPNRNNSNNVKGMTSTLGLDVFEDEDDAETTSVKNVEIICGAQNSTIYNLNGQIVNPNSANKGVYIKNGTKFIVK